MENASKALIIAGAILLSILIIALGMKIYNSASSSVGSADLSAQEINSHNSQFTSFERKISGSQVISLINQIRTNNENNDDKIIFVNMSAKTTKCSTCSSAKVDSTAQTDDVLNTFIKAVKSSSAYYVTVSYNNSGLINGVEIHVYSDSDPQDITFTEADSGPTSVENNS